MTHALNPEVTNFLNAQNHPLRTEIEQLRQLILKADERLIENIKWNGPNYSIGESDRITMKIQPPKQIQLIFHRGAKKLEQPKTRLIQTDSKLLIWRANDRAIASFRTLDEITEHQPILTEVIQDWLHAAK